MSKTNTPGQFQKSAKTIPTEALLAANPTMTREKLNQGAGISAKTAPRIMGGTSNFLACDVNVEKKIFPDGNFTNDIDDVADVVKEPLKATNGMAYSDFDEINSMNFAEAIDAGNEKIEAAKVVIDRVLLVCKDNPGELYSNDFLDAVKTIRYNQALWAAYRVRIKKAKPSGVLLSDIDEATAPEGEIDTAYSVADELVSLALSKGVLFFDPSNEKAFIEVDVDGITKVLAIGSKTFIQWLSYAYYMDTKARLDGAFGKSASEANIKQASFALAGIATHDGDKQPVYLRSADHNGGHYLFIADEQMRVIELMPTGWRILGKSSIKFWKPAAMQSLPIPIEGGNLNRIWEFVNITDEKDRLLVLAWMLECLRKNTPFIVLSLTGDHGAAKSSAQDKMRELTDNNQVKRRALPKSVEDVFVSANNNWVISFENISHLSSQMQDAICTMATGGGLGGRQLYTNDEESLLEAKRPVIINSIPTVITAQDLTDRAICIEMPELETVIEELVLEARWDEAKPSIFGGLLDLFVKTLEILPTVKLVNPPRMADFTRLGEAMAQALGYKNGEFTEIYKSNRADSVGRALESSPVALAIVEMVIKHELTNEIVFNGTTKALLDRLTTHYKNNAEGWPKAARGLGDILKRQSKALKLLGIIVVQGTKPERMDNGDRGIRVLVKKAPDFDNIDNIGNMETKVSSQKSFLSDDRERF